MRPSAFVCNDLGSSGTAETALLKPSRSSSVLGDPRTPFPEAATSRTEPAQEGMSCPRPLLCLCTLCCWPAGNASAAGCPASGDRCAGCVLALLNLDLAKGRSWSADSCCCRWRDRCEGALLSKPAEEQCCMADCCAAAACSMAAVAALSFATASATAWTHMTLCHNVASQRNKDAHSRKVQVPPGCILI